MILRQLGVQLVGAMLMRGFAVVLVALSVAGGMTRLVGPIGSPGPAAESGVPGVEFGQSSAVSAQAPNRRLQAAHVQALAFAKARELVRAFPVATSWAVPPAYLERFRNPAKPRTTGTHPVGVWFPIGPAPIAADPPGVWGVKNAHETGRIISIAATPQGPAYAGAEFGGVWEYTRSTRRWRALTDDQPSPQIGAITIDPSHPGTVYAGTGDDNSMQACGMSYMAQGLLKSDSRGQWTVVGASALAGAGIARIVVGAGTDAALLVATSGGVFRSTDGGVSFKNTYANCVTDMAISPASATTIYSATQSGPIRSTDGGLTWGTEGLGSLPLPAGFTIQDFLLGVSRGGARADVLYASVTTNGCKDWAAFRSGDGGRTWANLGMPKDVGSFCSIGQAHSLAVDPINANLAAFGGGWIYIYNAAAKSWTEVDVAGVAHSDQRAMTFDAAGHLYIGNDGGAWELPVVTNVKGGVSLNDGGLQVTEFERGLSISPDATMLLAGSQDNGTSVYEGTLTWAGPRGADGAATAIDQNDATHQFAEDPFSQALSEKTARTSWTDLQRPSGCEAGLLAISPALPTRAPVPTALFIGGRLLCGYAAVRAGGAMSWKTLPQACPKPGPTECQTWVTSLRVDPLEPAHVFAGWNNGAITFSVDSGKTWKSATAQPLGGGIESLAISPDNPYIIAVATSAGHVWTGAKVNTSTPGWSDVTGNLPVVDGMHPSAILYAASGIIVGTDVGTFIQQPGAASWAILGRGFPVSKFSDLLWKADDLVAITYGRGAWEIVSPAGGSK